MSRIILVHLNIEVPDNDGRKTPEICEALAGAIEVGSDDDNVRNLVIEIVAAEQI